MSVPPPTTHTQLQPVLEQSLTKIDTVVHNVYQSQETLAQQLDLLEQTLREFDTIQNPGVSPYIEKILSIKEIVDKTEERVAILRNRTTYAKERLRERLPVLSNPTP